MTTAPAGTGTPTPTPDQPDPGQAPAPDQSGNGQPSPTPAGPGGRRLVDDVRSATRGDPAPQQPTPATTGPGSRTAQPAGEEPTEGEGDGQPADRLDKLPAWAKREIEHARRGEESKRLKANELSEQVKTLTATQQEFEGYKAKQDQLLEGVAKLFGLTEGGEEQGKGQAPDPEKQLAELAQWQQRYRERTIELAVHRAAGSHAADAERLLDSRSFAEQVHKLDPDAEGFPAQVSEAIRGAVAANPVFKAATTTPTPAPPSGGTFAGGPGTAPDPSTWSVDQFREARRKEREARGR